METRKSARYNIVYGIRLFKHKALTITARTLADLERDQRHDLYAAETTHKSGQSILKPEGTTTWKSIYLISKPLLLTPCICTARWLMIRELLSALTPYFATILVGGKLD